MENKGIKELRLAELRAFNESEEEMIVEGYAATFNDVTDLGWYKEVIDPKAFDTCNMRDCVFKYNHNDNCLILARTRNNSLQLAIDDKGLKVRASLIDTQNNKDIYKMIRSGLLDKMSFAFHVDREEWDYETDTRRILGIDRLFDVSVVDVPAYESTEICARSQESYEKEKESFNERKRLELELQLLDL